MGEALYKPGSVALILLAAVALRIAALHGSGIELFFDEAQYWTWSKAPALGYYSKPPVIAWLIALTTEACGDTPFCVRLSAPILHGLAAFAVYLAGQELYTRWTGFWAALLYITLPAVTVSSFSISSDAPLMLCWAWGFFCFARALNGNGDRWWVLTGLCAGFGCLSKYTMAVFMFAAVLYMLIHREHRKLLFGPFILASLVACFVFLPNLMWNVNNDFVSFRHTNENVVGLHHALDTGKLLEFVAAQMAVFGPITFAVLMLSLRSARKYCQTKEGALLLTFTFLLLAIACAIAAASGAQAHWAAPAYIAGCILVADYLLERGKGQWLKAALAIHVAFALLVFAAEPAAQAVEKATGRDPLKRTHVWNGLAAPASKALLEHPGSVLASDERKAVATLMYRLRTKEAMPYPVMKWNPEHLVQDHYDLMTDLNLYRGKDVIFISRNPETEKLTPYFTDVRKLSDLVVSGERFHLFDLQGFKGY